MSFRTAYGYKYSENGWRMCNRDECVTVTVAGMGLHVRSGYAAEVLGAWVRWYHENVEPIDLYKPLDDWGWSNTNDVATSNHLSGTGVDLNATQYPWGRRVMPADRIAKVRRGLALFEGNIFWGADWSRADEMHYQLGAGTAAGDGASAKLIDFVQRRIKNGRLVDSVAPAALDVGRVNAFTQGFMGPIGSDIKDSREQLCGSGSRDLGEFDGWPQLGLDTFTDGLAAVLEKAVSR
ncbi:endolysin [Gordonia phage Obliviate]|uniref:Lysin A, L-Ala-D-Glu peptidase domain n=1 Tax=Gordonia phage Frokostdame TaxID=2250320 RepID=A0A345L310_9CAUD|nr:endolysin [Gordonia phage Utz]YP_009301762.1 endolysin [Gordonia phage Obliviate]YP_009304134.1 endolysin [Gordonia phage Guacamole]YP_010096897.1 endolysin [Gordonia phage Frokostdame]QBG78495.1 lysin A, L-Ala-D-Glu peptidase domain [Gordonia phage Barco]QDB74524.1 lysin A, L-Ala-D-Glu peptidase domain [Gordonia phage Melba]QDH47698.1 lysin A, L-Ala-D-Glu peptidase domain [Gordonia phage Mellie]QDH85341.1 lysin A, L-Ala-D-Glu peptidase domain [Gordonia phage MintFen]QDM56757.1 lysin A, 